MPPLPDIPRTRADSRWSRTRAFVGGLLLFIAAAGCSGVTAREIAQPVRPTPSGSWRGTCDGTQFWSDVRVNIELTFQGDDAALLAAGRVDFASRNAIARFSGQKTPKGEPDEGNYVLLGTFTEQGGLGVVWDVTMRLEPPSERGRILTGSLVEVSRKDSRELPICDFVWSPNR